MNALLEELFAKPDNPVDHVSTDLIVDDGEAIDTSTEVKLSLDPHTCVAVASIFERLIPPISMALDDRIRLSVDESGHEHKGKGPGGGQFTSGSGRGAETPKPAKPAGSATSQGKHRPAESSRSPVAKWAAKRFKDPAHAKAFVKWFGDSKVVDENGKPLVVYHGATQSFDQFKPNAFFSDKPEVASEFAKSRAKHAGEDNPAPRTIASFVRLKSPLVIDAEGKHAGDIQFARMDRFGYRKAIEDARFDGVIITNTKDEGNLYLVKNPSNVKSATGNRGSFDPDNPKITMSKEATEWQL